MEISTDLIDEYVWKNLDRWADKDALVSRVYIAVSCYSGAIQREKKIKINNVDDNWCKLDKIGL